MVVLVVSSADKQRQRFTQVQAPRVEVKTLLPACLVLIVWDYAITWELWRGIDIARAFGGSSMAPLDRHPSQPLNRLGLGSL